MDFAISDLQLGQEGVIGREAGDDVEQFGDGRRLTPAVDQKILALELGVYLLLEIEAGLGFAARFSHLYGERIARARPARTEPRSLRWQKVPLRPQATPARSGHAHARGAAPLPPRE